MLKHFKASLVLISGLLPFLASSEVVVIVNASNSSDISSEDVKRIFTGKENKFADGQQVIPINLPESSPVRNEFDLNNLGRNSKQVKAYWSKLLFNGQGTPPKEFPDQETVVNVVKRNANTIAYVERSFVTPDVRVIELN